MLTGSPAALLLAVCAMVVMSVGAGAAGVTVIRNGQPLAKIYVRGPLEAPATANPRKAPSPDEQVLARAETVRELNYHLQKMSGTPLEVVATDDAAQVQGPAIVLGELAVALGAVPQKTTALKEGFRLLTKGNLVLIGGESDAAVRHGAFALLRTLGCDWVMPGTIGEVIPARTTVTIPEADASQAPDFLVRNLWYRGYNQPRLPAEDERFTQWLHRQQGGRAEYNLFGAGGHVWDAFIARHKAEFAKDPTMLALCRDRDGVLKRMGPQLESTHPRVVELFVQDIKDTYAKNIAAGTWTKDTVAAFGIGPADGLGYSMSPEALAMGAGRIDPVMGEADRTDEVVLLGNRILEQVKQEYPNCYVGFYSYSVHADYPARYTPDPHIVPIFAPISFSRLHSVLDPNSKTQAYYRDVVEQWARLAKKQGNVLIYRGYNWNLAENMMPYSKVRIWGEELPYYKARGITALNVEATKAWAVNGPSDYVFMRLAWDTSRKWQDLLHEYCVNAFGAAAPPMERYLLRLIATQHGAGQEAGSYHAFPLIYNEAWVKQGQADFAQAQKLAQTPEQKTRVQHFADNLEALRLYLDYFQATLRLDFPAVKTKFDAMHAFWKQCYDMNTDLVANETPAYLNRFMQSFVDEGVKFSSAPYRMLVKVPDALPTAFDPYLVGDRMQLQDPSISDDRFLLTKTSSSTWDAQGLSALRTASVWYRFRFRLPADAQGQPIGLFLGGFEDEARVWINGQLVGTSGQRFSKPAEFDLTDGIRYDGENVLAVQVVRNSMANELGLGGLIRPSFIFAGPRLEQKAPKPLKVGRILPGGEMAED